MKKQFYELQVGNNAYRLRIKARQAAQLEKLLGQSPLTLFVKMSANMEDTAKMLEGLPSMETYAIILNASLQAFEHGFDMNKTYELIDEFVEDGHSVMELLNVVGEILKVSGYMPEQPEEEKAE